MLVSIRWVLASRPNPMIMINMCFHKKNVLVGTHEGEIVAKISGFQRSYTPADEWVDPDDVEIFMPIRFTPPEITSGDGGSVCDPSGDVWCFGCTSMTVGFMISSRNAGR